MTPESDHERPRTSDLHESTTSLILMTDKISKRKPLYTHEYWCKWTNMIPGQLLQRMRNVLLGFCHWYTMVYRYFPNGKWLYEPFIFITLFCILFSRQILLLLMRSAKAFALILMKWRLWKIFCSVLNNILERRTKLREGSLEILIFSNHALWFVLAASFFCSGKVLQHRICEMKHLDEPLLGKLWIFLEHTCGVF